MILSIIDHIFSNSRISVISIFLCIILYLAEYHHGIFFIIIISRRVFQVNDVSFYLLITLFTLTSKFNKAKTINYYLDHLLIV